VQLSQDLAGPGGRSLEGAQRFGFFGSQLELALGQQRMQPTDALFQG
jgi:hypothetical protein